MYEEMTSMMKGVVACVVSIMLCSCAADIPAPTERKEKLYYGQSGVVHIVRISRLQNIKEIAHSYGVDVVILAKLNHRSVNAMLAPGEVIKIPTSRDIQFEEKLSIEEGVQDYYGDIEGVPLGDDAEIQEKYFLEDHDVGALDEIDKTYMQSIESVQKGDFKCATPLHSKRFIWPVSGKVISRYRQDVKGTDEGISIASPLGAVVRAAADGEVMYADQEPKIYGNLIIIKHTGNYLTAYAHNDKISVKKGMKVKQGQPIATVGKTGAVTVPQLNFLIRKNKKTIDPEGVDPD